MSLLRLIVLVLVLAHTTGIAEAMQAACEDGCEDDGRDGACDPGCAPCASCHCALRSVVPERATSEIAPPLAIAGLLAFEAADRLPPSAEASEILHVPIDARS